MRELNTREKIITAVVGLVAIVFFVNQFVLEPHTKKVRKLRAELEELNKQTTSIGPKLVEFNSLNSNLIKKRRQVAELEQALSYRAGVAELIHEVSRQAKTQGLQIQNIRPGGDTTLETPGGKVGEFRQLVLNLGIQGQYIQLGEFISSLEKQPFYLKVAELRVERGRQCPQLLEIQLQLEITVRS
ncbi:MAG: type 4a pilus biogenesis protein PilO [Deltaproteobacteria bacterium]|nr:type 4a pilus biogenesis protein PilO [Deltaproteobacteria bacterium]